MQQGRITAGILNGSEIFTNDTNGTRRPMCLSRGSLFEFNAMPSLLKSILYQGMKNNPVAEKAMVELVGDDEELKLTQFAMCQYGLADGEPDIDDDGNLSAPEYVPCPNRGVCKQEGKGCCSIMFSEGVFLSPAETRIFKLITLSNEEIADRLFISHFTVGTHIQNILVKTGFKNKIELAVWGTSRNII